MEIFKPIPGYEGHYEVSNMGNIRSLKKGTTKILKQSNTVDGYLMVNLHKDKITKPIQIHRLVAMAFLNHVPCGHKIVVDHINDNKKDNRLENLQILTSRENSYKTQGKYSSNYKGVCWNKSLNKWQAQIEIDYKNIFLGVFINEYDAHLAYQNKAQELIKQQKDESNISRQRNT